jgi:DNA (cytosine-5)-methyltransferase 1
VAWRVLDAQYFGVPQRRRRVFIVGCLGDETGAGKILFERNGLRRDTEKSNEKRENSSFGTPIGFTETSRKVANTIPAELYHHGTVVNQDLSSGHIVVH